MDMLELIKSNYNYYPTTAIDLCVISYDSHDKISQAVSAKTNLSVVWGPARLTHWDGIAYSLMYVAANKLTGEYFVVIRGTNFDSLSSWLEQDFAIGSTQRFAALPGNPQNVPASAVISQGTFNGMSDLISLRDPLTGLSVVDYLKRQKPRFLYVTGHSLGGTLTPAMELYLNAMLYGGNIISNMASWSFAGLTAGGTGFNNYLNYIVPNDQGFLWRFHNSLDIAPLFWYSQEDIKNIYATYDLAWGDLEKYPIEHLFNEANSAGIGYAQPQAGQLLPGKFDSSIIEDYLWSAQALHQHHSTTYQELIKKMFPVP